MLNLSLLQKRLGQYGVIWLTAFLVPLIVALAATQFLGMSYTRVADPILLAGFILLGGVLTGFAGLTLASGEGILTKVFLMIPGLFLALPLMWSPVLGVAAGAWVAHVTIEYSEVYAAFRILVGRGLYDVTELLFGSPLVEAAWSFMEGFATFVGFLAALGQAWHMLRQISGRAGSTAS